ncbi:hypothetical protein Poly24_21990 [Rosistilla carotiformis]|uniref:Uncharacterized protein n=1 Tax=Rosistilla carotiformis TaxID=2528017 RepID=A0A518JSH6_9BACT|nr:hypothetical protein [Rosistilla carotiformis]QDV68490.1 hypothetical protein Poly24_21990 [Rosistilla carotiformis]
MSNAQRLDEVRAFLQAWFSKNHPSNVWNANEAILIREGHYCGRRFAFGPYTAIWFVEENQIKIFDPDGSVAVRKDCCELFQEVSQPTLRRAA